MTGEQPVIVVTPVGGQGFLFGRGNQQISSRVLALAGRDRILPVATASKLAALGGRPLRVDTGDAQVDPCSRGTSGSSPAWQPNASTGSRHDPPRRRPCSGRVERSPVSGGHPYMPNSADDVRASMLELLGISEVETLFAAVPDHLRLQLDARAATAAVGARARPARPGAHQAAHAL